MKKPFKELRSAAVAGSVDTNSQGGTNMSTTLTTTEMTEAIAWETDRARNAFNSARAVAANKLLDAVENDMAVTSWEAEAVCEIAHAQARWEAWLQVQARVENGVEPREALRKTVERLLGTVRPGNSTGHGHRAFDTQACEGTLQALRDMQELAR